LGWNKNELLRARKSWEDLGGVERSWEELRGTWEELGRGWEELVGKSWE
jgi:hypothetical protein